ncbi:MAG TPA: hypothetical protein VN259_15880 [Xanthomonadales bacterium]|nr:hypothetical protein [Xanthomonadales bacterium]
MHLPGGHVAGLEANLSAKDAKNAKGNKKPKPLIALALKFLDTHLKGTPKP